MLIAHSGKKNPVVDVEERKKRIIASFNNSPKIKVEVYDGLLAEYAKKHEIHVVLRGLRMVSDFEYEFQMATMNRRLNPDLQTFFLMASEKFFFINSTLVKEVASHGGKISELVPAHVERALKEKLCLN